MTGPDQVKPAKSFVTWEPDDPVQLRMTARGLPSEPPISVPGLLSRTVARYPDELALATKKPDGSWQKTTYK